MENKWNIGDGLKYMLDEYIGIFYADRDWKYAMYDKIIDYYSEKLIQYANKDYGIIKVKNGITIYFVNIKTSRGFRFDKVIIQPEVIISEYDKSYIKVNNMFHRHMLVYNLDEDAIIGRYW